MSVTVDVVTDHLGRRYYELADGGGRIEVRVDDILPLVDALRRILDDEGHDERAVRRGLLAPRLTPDEFAKVRAFELDRPEDRPAFIVQCDRRRCGAKLGGSRNG